MNKKELLQEIDNFRNAVVCYYNYELSNKSAKIFAKIKPYLTKEEIAMIGTDTSEKYMVGCYDANDLGETIKSIYIKYDIIDTHIDNLDDVLSKYYPNYSYDISFGTYLKITIKTTNNQPAFKFEYLLVDGYLKKTILKK